MIIRLHKNNPIYIEPVIEVIKKLDDTSKNSVFLLGAIGGGKSTILKEHINRNKGTVNPIIDGSVKYGEYKIIPDQEIFKLYHICLILQKILNYIKTYNTYKYCKQFIELEIQTNCILKSINTMINLNNYKSKYYEIDWTICKTPELLLEQFLSIATKKLDYKSLTLVLDNFDAQNTSYLYQTYMYTMLSNYLKVIATISDKKVLNSPERKNNLRKKADLIEVNYSYNIEDIKEILDSIFLQDSILTGNIYRHHIGQLLSDEVIEEMIKKTNGNIFDMCRALRYLYSKINELSKEEYSIYLLDYIDNEINKDELISGIVKRSRKLYI